ncbi:MAG: SBBP repeat-containing protein, partial [Candidatus Hodarchaeales archaeon]
MIIVIGFSSIVFIGGLTLFNSWWSDAFTNSIDFDQVTQVLIDTQGNIIVVGTTNSEDFPSTFSDSNTNYNSYWTLNCFVSKFSPSGELIWSRVIGGSESDTCYDAEVDSQNDIIITGYSESENFPETMMNNDMESDKIFVMKLASNGTLLWSNTYEGLWSYQPNGMALDSQDNIIVTGAVYTDRILSGDHNITNVLSENVLVMKLRPNGSTLWKSFIGGSFDDEGRKVGVDSSDNIIVIGETVSNDFPVYNAESFYNASGYNSCFVMKMSSEGIILWSSLIGGENSQIMKSIAIDEEKNIFITGSTYSQYFPMNFSNNNEVMVGDHTFLIKYSPNGKLLWSKSIGREF